MPGIEDRIAGSGGSAPASGIEDTIANNGQPSWYVPPPPDRGIPGVLARSAGGNVLPSVAGVAAFGPGFSIGAGLGTLTGPAAPIAVPVLGVAGGLITSMTAAGATSYAQDAVLDRFPDIQRALGQDDEQRRSDQEVMGGVPAFVGSMLPQALMFRPSLDAFRSGARGAAGRVNMLASAGIEGATEAGQELLQDGQIDPTRVGLAALGGGLLTRETGLGRMVGGIGSRVFRPDEPADLLGATAPAAPPQMGLPSPDQFAPPFYVDSVGNAGRTLNQGAEQPLPTTDLLAVGPNNDMLFASQGEMFTPSQMFRPLGPNQSIADLNMWQRSQGGEEAPAAPTPPEAGDQLGLFDSQPAAAVPAPTASSLMAGMRSLTGGRSDPFTARVASQVATALRSGDLRGAEAVLQTEQARLETANVSATTVDNRLLQLAHVEEVVANFRQTQTNAYVETGLSEAARRGDQGANIVTGERPIDGTVADMDARTRLQLADEATAASQREASNAPRRAVLDRILADPSTVNPLARFGAELRRQGFRDPPRPAEVETIMSHITAREAFNDPELTEVPSAPDESGNFGIPERVEPTPQQVSGPSRSKYAPENFQLEAPPSTPADFAALDAAAARRAQRASRADPAVERPLPVEPEQGQLFDENGQPTPEADNSPPFSEAAFLTKATGEATSKFSTAAEAQAFLEGAQEASGLKPMRGQGELGKMPEKVRAAHDQGVLFGMANKDPDAEITLAKPEPEKPAKGPSKADGEAGMPKAERITYETVEAKNANLFKNGLITAKTRNQFNMLIQQQLMKPEAISDMLNAAAQRKDGPQPSPKAKARVTEETVADIEADRQQTINPGENAVDVNAQASAEREAFMARVKDALTDRLKKVGIDDRVTAHVVGKFTNMADTAGVYDNHPEFGRVIVLALDKHLGNAGIGDTFNHELIHAMREMNLFTPAEWKTLVAGSKRHAGANKFVTHRAYRDKEAWLIEEERVAEFFALRQRDLYRKDMRQRSVLPERDVSFLDGLIERVKKFLTAVREAFEDLGFKSSDEVFARLLAGEIGKRPTNTIQNTPHAPQTMQRITPENVEAVAKRTAGDILTNMGDAGRRAVLATLTTRQMAEQYGKKLPELHHYVDAVVRSGGAREAYEHQAAEIHEAWTKVPDADAVGELLIQATVDQVDVTSTPGDLANRFAALSPEGQAAYKSVLKLYSDQATQMRTILAKQISDSDVLSVTEKADALKGLNAKFGRLKVYFPLSRFGDYLVIAEKPDDPSSRIVTAHENRADQMREVEALKAEGYDARERMAHEFDARTDATSSTFLNAVNKALDKELVEHPDHKDAVEGMKSMINQLYLSLQPDASSLKNNITRRTVKGYSKDAQRVFSITTRRNAGYLAQLEHGAQLRESLGKMADASNDSVELGQVYNQLKANYNKVGEYSRTPVQDFLVNTSYVYMLGASPSLGVMHLLQTPMITAPMLSAHFGPARTTASLLKAAGDAASDWKKLLEHGREHEVGKTADEQAAIKYLRTRNLLGTTQTSTLAEASAPDLPASKAARKIMQIAGWLPHNTERFNRVYSGLSAYRMAKNDPKITAGLTDEVYARIIKDDPSLAKVPKNQLAAMRFAEKMVADSHLDYTRENAPYLFQPGVIPLGKLFTQFKKYQQGMMYALIHNAKASMDKDMTPQERQIARHTLFGILATHGTMTGLMGLPMVGTISFLLNIANQLFGDPNEPFDADSSIYASLVDMFGLDWGSVAARGIFYTPGLRELAPGDITNRVGLGDLLLPSNQLDTVDRQNVLAYMATAAGGPAASLLGQMAQGVSSARQGDDSRALEAFLPKVFRDMMRTARFQAEGVTTASGNVVVPAEELGVNDLAAQFFGFTPQNVEQAYTNRSAVTAAGNTIRNRRNALLRQYVSATIAEDQDELAQLADQIAAYNEARVREGLPRDRITGNTLNQAVNTRRRNLRLLEAGVSLPRDRQALLRYAPLDTEEE